MIISTNGDVAKVVCGKIAVNNRVMVMDSTGNIFVAVIKIVL